MTNIITKNENGTSTIQVDFIDEGVNLQGEINVKGSDAQVLAYLKVFENDLRLNFADLFPAPEVEEGGIE